MMQINTSNTFSHTAVKPAVWDPLEFCCFTEQEGSLDELEDFVASTVEKAEGLLEYAGLNGIPRPEVYKLLGSEVGDDRVDASNHPLPLAMMLVIQESVLKMKTSKQDTFLSRRAFNFCEVTSTVPGAKEQSFDYARKTDLRNLGYVDAPILRIILDVQKGDRSHSSSAEGKFSLIGARSVTRTELQGGAHLASWIQDGCLNPSSAKEPKYVSRTIGGSGCPPLYGNPDNTYLFLRYYKAGTYSRVYGSAINETRRAVASLDRGQPAYCLLGSRLRDKQEYLFVTYAEKILLDNRPLAGVVQVPEPLYLASGTESSLQATECRLINTKRLVTKRNAEVEIMRTNRMNVTLFGIMPVEYCNRLDKSQSRIAREKYEGARSANSAVQRLLHRQGADSDVDVLIREGFLSVGCGVQDVTRDDIVWMVSGEKGEIFSGPDVVKSEDMYLRSDVSSEESLRVGGIPLMTRYNGKHEETRMTLPRIGLWQTDRAMEEWADTVVQRLQDKKSFQGKPLVSSQVSAIFAEHREWVSDDQIITSQVLTYTRGKPMGTLLLCTADEKLCRGLAAASRWNIACIPPPDLIRKVGKPITDSMTGELEGMLPKVFSNIFSGVIPEATKGFVDTGSLSAYAMRMEEGTDLNGTVTGAIYTRKLLRIEDEPRAVTILKRLVDFGKRTTIRVFIPDQSIRTFVYPKVEEEERSSSNPIWRSARIKQNIKSFRLVDRGSWRKSGDTKHLS